MVKVSSPFSGEALGEVGGDTSTEVGRSLEQWSRGFPVLSPEKRAQILEALSQGIRERAEFLAELIAKEGGKPLLDARVEVARAATTVQLCAKAALEMGQLAEVDLGTTSAVGGRRATSRREPIGPVLAISAFNHPLNLIAHQAGSAIAAGCPFILKPALETPLCAEWFKNKLLELGWPSDLIRFSVAENSQVEIWARDPRVRFISFIGSARVGWHLRSVAAPGTRLALEHGGSAPVVVDDSADLETAIPQLIKGAFYHAGQVCVSVQRIYYAKNLEPEFLKRFTEAVDRLRVGDPLLEKTDVGPLIRARELTRLKEWIGEAVAQGAELLRGGAALANQCFQPTVLWKAPQNAKVIQEEVFGPLVSLMPFGDLDEAIELANGVPWEFQAGIFSKKEDRVQKAIEGLRASAVLVNSATTFRTDAMPFGGRGPSGLGVGGIPYSVIEMTQDKLIVRN